MFRKKKSEENKTPIEIHKEIFYSYQGNECKERKLVEELYCEIRTYYEKQKLDGKLNIHLERIRINNSLEKYSDTTSKRNELNKAFNLICMTAMFNVIIKIVESIPNIFNLDNVIYSWMKFGCYFLIILYIVYIMDDFSKLNEVHSNSEKDIVNNISLIVLDDIEKELNKDASSESKIQKDIKFKEIEAKEKSKVKPIVEAIKSRMIKRT